MAEETGAGIRMKSRADFEAWLEKMNAPKEICVALAERAALRSLPFVFYRVRNDEKETAALAAASFRAGALARVAAKYPSLADTLELSARAAAFDPATARAAAFAADAARAANASAAALAAAQAEVAAARAVRAVVVGADGDYWKALSADLQLVEGGISSHDLVDQPLWNSQAAPLPIIFSISDLKAALPRNENWRVWLEWYDRRHYFGSDPEELELIFATVPEEKWAEGPPVANAWIAERLRELAPSPPVSIREREGAPVSTHTEKVFDLGLGPCGQLIPHWLPADEAVQDRYGGFSSADLYADAREAFLDFAEHALDEAAGNYMPRDIQRAARRLRDSLPAALPETPPLSAERALGMALRAIDAAEKSGEISAQDMLFRHHLPELRGMYQRLAAIWPGLGDYREAARIDRFIEPNAEARKAQDLILATTAADASVASPALRASLNETIATLEAAEKDLPPGAGDEVRRRSLYDAMKAAAAQIAPIWSWTQNAAMKVQKVSSDAETTVQNLEKLGQRIEKARIYWEWIEKWW